MPKTRIRLAAPNQSAQLTQAFGRLRAEYELPEAYPAECVNEAVQAMHSAQLPQRDETSVPFFTIDPLGSMDLDQAMHLETSGNGFRVRYAIADVPLYVTPGGLLDAETRRRGETIYLPDERVPLHPKELSEDGASLLPGQVRSAFVWDMVLDDHATVTSTDLYRARVRSVERLDYSGVQAQVDAGERDERIVLLQRIGELRQQLELDRGGASLPMPEQEVSLEGDSYAVHFRPPAPVEDWNAQISLMTGMEAAKIMLDAGVGILRTMPDPEPTDVEKFRLQAKALGVVWPKDQSYGAFLRGLDRTNPRHLAVIYEAIPLFRGAAYTPFDGAAPQITTQAAVAAPYAHVTAPLRRLVDRFGLALCEAVKNGQSVPDWVRQALPELPDIMKQADSRANKIDREAVNIVEAATLSRFVGQELPAFVVATDQGRCTVQFVDHAVVADAKFMPGPDGAGESRSMGSHAQGQDAAAAPSQPQEESRRPASGGIAPGEAVLVRVDTVDVVAGKLTLTVRSGAPAR